MDVRWYIAVRRFATLRCAMPHCALLTYAVLCCAVPCCAVQGSLVPGQYIVANNGQELLDQLANASARYIGVGNSLTLPPNLGTRRITVSRCVEHAGDVETMYDHAVALPTFVMRACSNGNTVDLCYFAI